MVHIRPTLCDFFPAGIRYRPSNTTLSCWWATESWELKKRYSLLVAEIIFMFCFTKVVKLVGLFRKNPHDLVYWPVSVTFRYFHGLIKLHALFTLKKVRLERTAAAMLMVRVANNGGRHPGVAEQIAMSTTSRKRSKA